MEPDHAKPLSEDRLLVVDDDPAIRRLVLTYLRLNGFASEVAGSGEEPLAIFLQDPARIRVVITDLDMPGISGLQLASLIRETSPSVKILILSRSASAPVQTMMKRIDNLAFLRKPFTGNQFIAEVKSLLHAMAP